MKKFVKFYWIASAAVALPRNDATTEWRFSEVFANGVRRKAFNQIQSKEKTGFGPVKFTTY